MIEDIFEEMRKIGAVRTAAEFSVKWLGREGSYMRGLKSKRRCASPAVLATCAVRLLSTADGLASVKLPSIDVRQVQLRSMANRCLEGILAAGARR
jgi:hypothetical protein